MRNYLHVFKILLFSFILIVFNNSIITYAMEVSNISAQNAISIDMKTGEIIFSKNIDENVQPASVTKLLTALLLDQHKNKDDLLFYSKDALDQPSSSIFVDFSTEVVEGNEILASTVMDALLIYSANDIATLIADNISGSIDKFSLLMDEKAKEIGMHNSNFYTPSGLDSDKRLYGNQHYTSAYDLSKLGTEALKSDWIRETIAKEKDITLDIKNDTPIIIDNTNNNLGENGCIGGKTGYTEKAQRCLLSFYERDDRYILGIVLGCPTRPDSFKDMTKLIDYSYKAPKTLVYKKGDTISTENIDFKPLCFFGPSLSKQVTVIADEDISFFANEENNSIEPKLSLEDLSVTDLSSKKEIGTLTYTFRDNISSFKLSTLETRSDFIKDAKWIYITFIFCSIAVIFVCILCYKHLNKKKIKS